jgi:RND family efflux transporter MFP subunit
MTPIVRQVHCRISFLSYTAIALLTGLALGCGKPAAPEEEKTPPATVKWEGPLQSALEEWTELVGATTPQPDRAARVSAPVEGRVVSVLTDADGKPVVEGQQVEKGAVLAQLDATLIKANLAKLVASHELLLEEQKQAQLAVDLAFNEVERLRKQKEEDDKRMRETGSRIPLVSPVDREKADIALKVAQSKFKGSGVTIIVGEKEIEAVKAQLKLYTLAAPVAGRLGRFQATMGQTLAVGAPVADVFDLDDQIDVLCYVPPSLASRLRLGQAARTGAAEKDPAAPVEVEADGQIAFIADQAEPETGNFAVKVRFSNKEAKLRANRVLRLRILMKPTKECLSLPEAAVQEDEATPTVVVVTDVKTVKNADGKEDTVGVARRLQAVLGVRDRSLHQVEIVSLEDPEKDAAKRWKGEVKDALFVTSGGQGLQTGDNVKLEVETD